MAKRQGFQFMVVMGAVINLLFFNAILQFLGEMFMELFANVIGHALVWLVRKVWGAVKFVMRLIAWLIGKLLGWDKMP